MPLTKKQKEMLKQHKIHHTKKHMDLMKELMRLGISFKKSHTITQKYLGK